MLGSECKKSLTVKIQLPEDSENILAVNFPNTFNVGSLKSDIAKKFKVKSEHLMVHQDHQYEICDDEMLHNLLLNNFGIIEMKMRLRDEAVNDGVTLDTGIYYSSFTLPDIITVHIPMETEDGQEVTRDLVVEIENKSIKKPFLGGYVHKKTNIEYHHAFTQTGPALEKINDIKESKFCRETQTVELRRSAVDTNYDRSTQHFGDANELLYLKQTDDVEVEAQDFETFEESQNRKKTLEKVLLIQRNFRRFRLKVCIKKCAAEYRRLQTIKRKREERIKQDYINSNRKSGNFPRTKKDFDMLFAQISTWKENETKRITEEYTGPSRIVEIQALLEKEIQLLNGIENRRAEIQKEMQAARQDRMLEKIGETVKWIGYKNALIEMDTLRTQRARKLAELFKKLRHPSGIIEDRLSLLHEVSEALSDENTSRIIELENLFQRERELLLCKLTDDSLEILRQRQLVVFMDVIRDEERNGSSKPLCRVCEKCKSVLPMAKFVMHSRQKDYDLCRKCSSLKTAKTDLSVYRAILRGIQRDERRRGALTSLAFIIQETDIKYIIENIWHGISILSQCGVTSDLRLPRWNVDEEWAPWNCICLTDTESRIHVVCTDLREIYGEKIINDLPSKQSLAKSTFKHLKKMDQSFADNGDWLECGIKDKTV